MNPWWTTGQCTPLFWDKLESIRIHMVISLNFILTKKTGNVFGVHMPTITGVLYLSENTAKSYKQKITLQYFPQSVLF